MLSIESETIIARLELRRAEYRAQAAEASRNMWNHVRYAAMIKVNAMTEAIEIVRQARGDQ